jgi:hypothetical protein
VKNTEVVDFLNACLKESQDTWGAFRKIQAECYDRYRSYRDHSKKKSWQHKIVVPTVFPAIKGSAGLLKRILMKSDEFFKFVPERQDNSPQATDPVTGQPIEDQMDNFARAFTKKVRFHMDEAKYISKFEEAVESALAIMMGVLRFTPKNVEDTRVIWAGVPLIDPTSRQPMFDPATGQPAIEKYDFVAETSKRAKLNIEVVNPLLLHFPLDMGWLIEETRVPLHEILANEEGVLYDKKELKRMQREEYEDAPRTDADTQRLTMLKLIEPKNRFRKEVVLHTFWGTVTDQKGNVIVKDGRFIVANQKYVLLKPSPSPYWLRKHPYIFITPLKVLFMAIGAGMVDGIRPLINAIDNLVNIAGDKALFALLAPGEINIEALKDPQQAEGGLVPGKLFKTKGPLGQALHQTQGGDIPKGSFTLIDLLRSFVQNYTGWTEFIQGMPSSRRDLTATEVDRKTEASSLSFENIAASIENSGVVEAVEIARDMTVQFFLDPLLNPETEDIFLQEKINLRNLPEAEKYAFLNKRYPIKVKGLQAFFDNEKVRQDILGVIEVAGKVPMLAQRINWEELATRFFTSFSWPNPEGLVVKGPLPMGLGMPGMPIPGMPGVPAGALPPGPGATPPAEGKFSPEKLISMLSDVAGAGTTPQ